MSTWILIVVMISNGGHAYTHAVSMQEFNTQADCQYVANHLTKFKGLRDASCFRKGDAAKKEKT
jgi:hypothetical protein